MFSIYYRIKLKFHPVSYTHLDVYKRQGYIADLINNSETLYSDVNNQKLQIASNVINISQDERRRRRRHHERDRSRPGHHP